MESNKQVKLVLFVADALVELWNLERVLSTLFKNNKEVCVNELVLQSYLMSVEK